ncbi:hypothetical protein QBC47DRAFT_360935 [Echria macrotheca]|uniref:Uncharacterized protein n=1 Tax=Echria macrotheca TaxID=438768 RepID=A0AAJ0BCT1_9PEZI|nr:hypothetical protein QBC47DRAFT_360935 [Echria macrotheca]
MVSQPLDGEGKPRGKIERCVKWIKTTVHSLKLKKHISGDKEAKASPKGEIPGGNDVPNRPPESPKAKRSYRGIASRSPSPTKNIDDPTTRNNAFTGDAFPQRPHKAGARSPSRLSNLGPGNSNSGAKDEIYTGVGLGITNPATKQGGSYKTPSEAESEPEEESLTTSHADSERESSRSTKQSSERQDSRDSSVDSGVTWNPFNLPGPPPSVSTFTDEDMSEMLGEEISDASSRNGVKTSNASIHGSDASTIRGASLVKASSCGTLGARTSGTAPGETDGRGILVHSVSFPVFSGPPPDRRLSMPVPVSISEVLKSAALASTRTASVSLDNGKGLAESSLCTSPSPSNVEDSEARGRQINLRGGGAEELSRERRPSQTRESSPPPTALKLTTSNIERMQEELEAMDTGSSQRTGSPAVSASAMGSGLLTGPPDSPPDGHSRIHASIARAGWTHHSLSTPTGPGDGRV